MSGRDDREVYWAAPDFVWTARGFRLAVPGKPSVWKSCGMPVHGTSHSFPTLIHRLPTLRRGQQGVREVSFSTTINFYFKTVQRYRTGFLKEMAKHEVCSRQADNHL